MLKKIYTGIYLVILVATINVRASEQEDGDFVPNFTTSGTENSRNLNSKIIANFSNATINHHEFRETHYVAYKAYHDSNATFGQKFKNSFAEGCWESFQGIPVIFTHAIMQAAATLMMKKFVDWFNGAPSEAPTKQEVAIDSFVRKEVAEVAFINMQLQVNEEALKGLKADQKIFENDQEELKNIEQRKQELLADRKLLMAKKHTATQVSAQVEYDKKQTLFMYPKAA